MDEKIRLFFHLKRSAVISLCEKIRHYRTKMSHWSCCWLLLFDRLKRQSKLISHSQWARGRILFDAGLRDDLIRSCLEGGSCCIGASIDSRSRIKCYSVNHVALFAKAVRGIVGQVSTGSRKFWLICFPRPLCFTPTILFGLPINWTRKLTPHQSCSNCCQHHHVSKGTSLRTSPQRLQDPDHGLRRQQPATHPHALRIQGPRGTSHRCRSPTAPRRLWWTVKGTP